MKFKFKLEGLLKLRASEEEKVRTELGHMQVMVEQKKIEIENEKMVFNFKEIVFL